MSTIEPASTVPTSTRPEDAPDDALVLRIRAGETHLFECLIRRYNPRLYRVARAIVRDAAEAEDVIQQAYVNAYTHLDQFAERAQFSTWLTRIAMYEALGRVRRRRPIAEIDAMSNPDEEVLDALTSKRPNPEQQALTEEVRLVLEDSIDALPESARAVFVLRMVEGLDTAETAQCLGVKAETVKTRLHRARALLRKELLDRAGLVTAEVYPFHLSRCDRVVAGVFRRLGLALPPSTLH